MTVEKLKYVLFFSSVTAKIPLFNVRSGRLEKCKVLPITVGLIAIITTCITFESAKYVYERHFLTQITSILQAGINCGSALASASWSFEPVQELLQLIGDVDEIFLKFDTTPVSSKHVNLILFCKTFIYLTAMSLNMMYFYFNLSSLAFTFIINTYFHGFLIYGGIVIELFLLNVILQRVRCFTETVDQVKAFRMFTDRELKARIDNLAEIYDKTCDLVDCFNCIFGWEIFLQMMYFLTAGLTLFDFMIAKKYGELVSLYTMCSVISIFSSLLTGLAVYSQRITDAWRNSKKCVCKAIVSCRENESGKVQWQALSHQIAIRPLIISAAGFFDVNHGLVYVLTNMLVSYVVVLIQLNQIC